MNPWAGWSADDWVRHYGAVHAVGALPGVAPQVQVLAYRNMWSPYVKQVVDAANHCADTYEQSADPAMRSLAGPYRIDAMALQTQWNNAGDLRIVLHPAALLQESQQVVLTRCNQVLAQVRTRCPSIPIPTAVPAHGIQTQIIGTLEHARLIPVGVIQQLYQTAQGYLATAKEFLEQQVQHGVDTAERGLHKIVDPLVDAAHREEERLKKMMLWIGAGVLGVVALSATGRRSRSE